jgi:hypothetical protein
VHAAALSILFGVSFVACSSFLLLTANSQPKQTGHEWMESAPTFCKSKNYSNLTPKQMAACDEAAVRWHIQHLSKNWQTITAANGQTYEIALDTIIRDLPANLDPRADLRGAMVIVHVYEGETLRLESMVSFYFDCHDRFQTVQNNYWSPVTYAPPLSIAAKIAAIACKAKN